MSVHNGWPRWFSIILVGVAGFLAFITLILTGVDIAKTRSILNDLSDSSSSYSSYSSYSYYSYDYGDGVENYPYTFSALLLSLVTLLNAIITFVLLILRKANGNAVGGVTTVIMVCWLAVIGYGAYVISVTQSFGLDGTCSSYSDSVICETYSIELAWFSLSVLNALAAIVMLSIAFHAGTRERHARYGIPGHQAYAPNPGAYPQYQGAPGGVAPMGQIPYSSPTQPQPARFSAVPPPPSGIDTTQPFFQNGRWMQMQAVPINETQHGGGIDRHASVNTDARGSEALSVSELNSTGERT
ncbi:MAG: hypothetical protein M1825_001936 [Sarcosagium campestre]|nr:MAG: hypothetical protein M1825_001936 [Sarcosagium campestre]